MRTPVVGGPMGSPPMASSSDSDGDVEMGGVNVNNQKPIISIADALLYNRPGASTQRDTKSRLL